MTTVFPEKTQCPICDTAITVYYIGSTNNFGGQSTDFRSHAAGTDPLHVVVSQCGDCGYSDYSNYFIKPRDLSEAVKARIREEIKPSKQALHSRIYETIAQIAQIRGANSFEIADTYLKTAWCCDDEDDHDGEIAFRKLAIKNFIAALEDDELENNQMPITYLVGELYRRIGDAENARLWFDRVITADDNSEKMTRLRAIAQRQRDDPKAKF